MRENKWREDAQPEWPDAASGGGEFPATGSGTQALPETRGTEVLASGDETEALSKFPFPATTRPPAGPVSEPLVGSPGGPTAEPFGGPSAGPIAEPPAGSLSEPLVGLPGGPLSEPFGGPSVEPSPDAPAFRDPWDPSGAVGETGGEAGGNAHDPHEVTVQLDAVALRADHRLVGQAGGGAVGDADGSDGPVFVDESGRRSRRFRRIGIFVGIACAIYAVVIVATMLSGNSNAPWLPVPGQEGQEAGQVETSPLPTDSVAPTDATGVTPGVSPTPGDGTAPSPGASATAPGASATATTPGASADPKPTPTKTATSPVTRPSVSAKPTDEPTTSSPDPSLTPSTTPPGPSDSPAGGTGTGTDNLADGADSAPGLSTAPPLENSL
ncbi:hypothetical protein ACIGMX_23200 [Streptomyces aquilus]|uniref:Uncharacterized protein n=1 Tax=Streptomyces aquilus TaxID=2548456 RepID=A0A3Q9BVX2_9ACTN|nr:hypothetical protein [Streptomyces aquilus]AZP18216.1 hypothetical protein EJC51_20255 [Streptomyces aquilus]